jgi:hypothetical protein
MTNAAQAKLTWLRRRVEILEARLQRFNRGNDAKPGTVDLDDIEDLELLILEAKANLAQAEEGAT